MTKVSRADNGGQLPPHSIAEKSMGVVVRCQGLLSLAVEAASTVCSSSWTLQHAPSGLRFPRIAHVCDFRRDPQKCHARGSP